MQPYPQHPRVLLVGSDARTEAIAAGLGASRHEVELFALASLASPGLAGRCGRMLAAADVSDVGAVLQAVEPLGIDLAVIGPEAPLAVGLVDALWDRLAIPSFGPRRALARIETSKSWARRLLDANGIVGNPAYRVFESSEGLAAFVHELGAVVVKPDGLTGGKGVRVLGEHLGSIGDAVEYALELLHSDGLVVIEERLDGEEFSLQSITDGEAVLHCPAVQDHKRAFEGDVGPNTGGMGSYSDADLSLPFLAADDLVTARAINEAVVVALAKEAGEPFRGVLYGGFMATAEGVRLVEYNARFGDPEAMNVLPILEADLFELCWATATGSLAEVPVAFQKKATVCKYVVPVDYPATTSVGGELHVADRDLPAGVSIFWSSVSEDAGRYVMQGSRALAVVGLGDSLDEAEQRAEAATALVTGAVRHRTDIGTASLVAKRVEHMRQLRSASTRR